MATLGYVRSSNGPDLAQVGANEQLVSHTFPNTTSETLRITHVSAWVGNWSGAATMRFGIWAASSSSAAPGALLARTVEFSPTVSYVDGAGGQLRTVALETPYELAPGQVIALGVASRNNSAGIAMYQASAISQPNESFYRRSISGTNLVAAGGEVTNQGQLAIYVTGTTNQPPNAPTGLTPSGTITGTLKPVLSLIHNDPNGDASSQVRVQVQEADGSPTLWDSTQARSVADGARANLGYNGSPLRFYELYQWRARTFDRSGVPGPFSDWVTFSIQHSNNSPGTPHDMEPGTVVHDRAVTLEAGFSDPDLPVLPDGQAWEIFVAKQVVLRRLSDNVAVFNSGIVSTTTAERNALRSSTSVTLPSWDTWYVREIRHRDRRGAWSPTARLNIIARSGASVELPTQPAGRITNPGSIPAINAVYRNTANLSATRVRVGVFTDQGQLISQRELPISVSRNGTIATTFNALWGGNGFPFAEGTDYQYAVAARDTAGNWSGWSPYQQLSINARPNTPILYHPKEGTVSPSLPNTIVTATDPDQPSSELTVTAEYYDADTDELLGTTTLPNISGTTSHGYQPSDIITGYRNVKWRAQANDGFLSSAWSDMFTFGYQPVPQVSITSPTGPVIETSRPMITWASTDQQAWRIRGYDGNRLVYDTGIVAGSGQQHPVFTTSYWQGGERWNNHETFDWIVSVRDSSTLWGDSDTLTLTLEYIPPDPLIVESVESLAFYGAEGTHYAVIGISQPNATEEEFIRTIVDRVEIDGPAGNEDADTMVPGHFEAGNSVDTTFADFDMTSNQWYRYAIRYEVQSGVDVIESDPVYAEAMISFHGTLLHMPFDPLGTYVWLPYGTERYEPEVRWHQGHSEVMTVNGRAPLGYSDSRDYAEWALTSTLVERDGATVEQQRNAFRRLWTYQNKRFAPNGLPNSVCFREGRGGDDGRLYGRISEPRRRHSYTRLYTFDFMFRELDEVPVEGGAQ